MNDMRDYLNKFKGNKVVLAMYPHPDDETMAAGGLLMIAKDMGFETVVVCLTHGEAGKNHAPVKGKTLAEIRKVELNNACSILGVDHVELADFGDGKLRGSEKKWLPWVNQMMKKYQPGIVVTYDHSGIYGHPDHIALSLAVNGPVVFWNTLSKSYANSLKFTKEVREYMTSPTHILSYGFDFVRKYLAARAHASQKLGGALPLPLWLILAIFNKEWYHKVDPKKNYPVKYLERTFS